MTFLEASQISAKGDAAIEAALAQIENLAV